MGNFGTIAGGAAGGAATGAAIGTAILPGIGTAVGAGVGAIAGGFGAAGAVNERDAALERMEAIPSFDPMQLSFLDQMQREKRSLESGFTTDFQVAKDLNKEMLAGDMSVAESVGASNPALAISMIDQSGKAYNTGINQSLGTISARSFGMTQSVGELINRISQRKLDLETYKTTQELGIATSDLQTFNSNVKQIGTSAATYLPGMLQGGGQSTTPSYTDPTLIPGGTGQPDNAVQDWRIPQYNIG